ncbi:Longitudinals lacking protein, isoforms J/P/Q/S/Z [Frankliniella fusca]|uniref:Longitudinals lacking protein, isoforms J/P/Q/S/Z n=1 Tax=Frankliniella fusca TaxID=407009 RepID=A0AAE1H821_9NEOP|nr:Longitudinals lacking protein, isoforms J/P/Q/S/Z [Frankliniella fusca]
MCICIIRQIIAYGFGIRIIPSKIICGVGVADFMHLSGWTVEKPWVCAQCSRAYKWQRSLVSHQRTECGREPQINCKMCGYSTKVKSNLKRHMRRLPPAAFHSRAGKDGRAMPTVMCPTPGCNRKYYWRNSLARHLREECGLEPRFQCPQCSYRAKQKAPMLRHIKTKHKNPYSEPCFIPQL